MSVVQPALRRSAGMTALIPALAVVVAQVMLRGHPWQHEWAWATYQSGFDTVLLGPVIAAAGAWEGCRLAAAQPVIASSPSSWRATLLAWWCVTSWGVVAYACGVLARWSLVYLAGTPGHPGLGEVPVVLVPIGLLAAAASAGVVLGRHLARLLSLPLAAVAWFAATIYLYSVGPAAFVTVGGATGSLVALRPRGSVQAVQLALFAAVVLVCLVAAASGIRMSQNRIARGAVLCGASAAVLGAGAGLVALGPALLHRTGEATVCAAKAPRVCTAAGYRREATQAHDRLVPYLAALTAAGVREVPGTFDQTALPGGVSVGPLTQTFLAGRASEAENLVVAAYVSKTCSQIPDPRLAESWNTLHWYLLLAVEHHRYDDPSLPRELTAGDASAQHALVRAAVESLATCSRRFGEK